MMGGDIFEGLPPPSHHHHRHQQGQEDDQPSVPSTNFSVREPPPFPDLKSALKRPNPTNFNSQDAAPKKTLKFKTTTDASEAQVIEAMQKIASHIRSSSKFAKASKLAIQLIQAGSVKPGTADHFFAILEAAMSSPTSCTNPSVRADYHALFSAAHDAAEFFNKKQKNNLSTWTIKAVVANELFTDDSFVFSKTAGRIKETISNLPAATEDDDIEDVDIKNETVIASDQKEELSLVTAAEENNRDECDDPFGLDALISTRSVEENQKPKGTKDAVAKLRRAEEEDENKRFLKSQREALLTCLEIAARRYKTPWCQTAIDILAKHAVDNVARFSCGQRDAIEKLWGCIKEQQIRRKQGKTVDGKLDMNGFERLQQKYANEHISIRRAVGGGGNRQAQQWLG